LIFRRENRDSYSLADKTLLDFLGIEVESNVNGKNALKIATVYACFRILTENIGKIPIKIYQNKQPTNHYLGKLLKYKPNPYMTAINFWKSIEFQRNLTGNGYAYIDMDSRGRILGLYPLDSSKVEPYIDKQGLKIKDFWYVVNTGRELRKVHHEQMLHFKGLTENGLLGISPLDYLKEIFENGKAAQSYTNKFYKNGMQTKGIIQYVGDLSPKAEENFRNKFEQMANGLENAHRISLLPIGYQYQSISQKLADAQFLENNKMTIQEIASAFGVKMHQINNLERSTFNNMEQQQQEFYIDTLQPILTMYEQELISKLLLDSEIEKDYFLKFNIDVILRSDIKTRYEAYRTGIQSGFLTPNEARAKEDQEPQEGGDELIVNGNMMKLIQAGIQYMKGGEKDNE
jgi:HK97 family phage portal protein